MSTLFHTLIDLDGVRVLSQSLEFSAKHANIGTVVGFLISGSRDASVEV